MTATAPLAHTCLRSDLIETMADWRGGGEFQGLSWHINVLVPAIGTLVEALEGGALRWFRPCTHPPHGFRSPRLS